MPIHHSGDTENAPTKSSIFVGRPPRSSAWLALLLTASCQGSIASDGGGATRSGGNSTASGGRGSQGAGPASAGGSMNGKTSGGALRAAPAHVRRLTVAEIENSTRDIFLGGARRSLGISDTIAAHGFDTNFEALTVTQPFAEALQDHAEAVSTAVAKQLPTLLPCLSAGDPRTCAGTFIDRFGPRVYRRPLAADERASLVQAFDDVRTAADAIAGIRAVVEAMLLSPNFLFRTEYGAGTSAAERLTGYELATALAFFFWSAPPDDALLAAAGKGELASDEGVRKWTQTLLGDARAFEGLRRFVQQWIEITPAALHPDASLGDDLASAMIDENAKFVESVLSSADDTLAALLTRSDTFVNASLAKLYGLDARAMGGALVPVKLDPAIRTGFFTQAAFLASHLGTTFAPVQLGRFVRTKLLCGLLPDPPPDVPPLPQAATTTARERFAMHEASPACGGCHKLMDRVGFGFERYDAAGRLVDKDAGQPLTGQGELVDSDVDGPFTGPVELGKRIAGSAQARMCVAQRMLEFALGRSFDVSGAIAVDPDAATAAVAGAAKSGTISLRALAMTLATTRAFTIRDASPRN